MILSGSTDMYDSMDKNALKNLKLSGAFIGRGWKIGILLLITVFVLAVSIRNALDLHKVLDDSTIVYTEDITREMAKAVSDIIELKSLELISVADSIGKGGNFFDSGEADDFMRRKAGILGFDGMLLLDSRGNYICSFCSDEELEADMQSILEIEAVQDAFSGLSSISYVGHQDLYYTAPVWNGERVRYVLVGIRSKENMQSMIAAKSFNGRCLNCLVDSKGVLLLASEDMRPFEQLEDIFEIGSQKEREAILEMEKNITRGEGGVFEFTSIDGNRNFLSYNTLEVNDWVIMTIVPADLISAGSGQYIFRSFMLIGGIFVTLAVSWLLLYEMYNSNRKKLIEIAFTDPLTAGMNDKAFQLKYQDAAEKQSMLGYAIVLLDVRNFKMVNESFGIPAGNKMLRYILQILDAHLKKENCEFAARNETDRFFVCMKECQPQIIQNRLHEMIDDINAFCDADCPHYQLSFRKGVCLVENENTDIITLQDRARMAAQQSRDGMGDGCVFYDESMTEKIRKEQELDALFEESLEKHDFLIYLQPKVGVENGRLEGAEALVRWKHPKKGMIFPSDFIPLFEKNGKICRLDLYVFEEACRMLSKRKREGKPLVPISVNLSRQHFYRQDFLDEFDAVFQKYDIPYENIEFELTESIFLDDARIEAVKSSIEQMHRMGFRCSLDDFGSGFSSLGMLKEFDVDTLKLDRSFFMDISSKKAKNVIRSVVELAKRLHVKTVAEGIEFPEQLEFLRRIQCDEVQGYIYAKPLPIPEFEEWEQKVQTER